ncbi:MAG: MoaD/ThiS family protein [Glaciimonas sp.]|nr:MoaD/ThiS family protein [Glaciimonas sp.]NMM36721.1 MoaD/ThiS family protein [Glaciimonas sp.]
MKITFKLYATLTDYLPPERKYNAIALDITPGTSIGDLLVRFKLPPKLVHLVLVNGVYIGPESRVQYVLSEGEVLAIWPPIAGG